MSSAPFTLQSHDIPANSTIENKFVFNGFGYEVIAHSPLLSSSKYCVLFLKYSCVGYQSLLLNQEL